MSAEYDVKLLDGIVLVILLLGITRGLFIGMVKEGFSMAGLGAAILAARYGTQPASYLLEDLSQGAIGPALAPWLAGSALVIGAIVVMALISRVVQRGVRAAGLTWIDRSGGALLGAAEGVLLSVLVVLGAVFILGRGHSTIEDSQSLALYDAARNYLQAHADELPGAGARKEWF